MDKSKNIRECFQNPNPKYIDKTSITEEIGWWLWLFSFLLMMCVLILTPLILISIICYRILFGKI
mgnify:CR=1 FL=1